MLQTFCNVSDLKILGGCGNFKLIRFSPTFNVYGEIKETFKKLTGFCDPSEVMEKALEFLNFPVLSTIASTHEHPVTTTLMVILSSYVHIIRLLNV